MDINKIGLCISSNINYYKNTYSATISTLLNSGCPVDKINFIIGGCQQIYDITDANKVSTSFTNINCFDFTAILYIIQNNRLYEYDY